MSCSASRPEDIRGLSQPPRLAPHHARRRATASQLSLAPLGGRSGLLDRGLVLRARVTVKGPERIRDMRYSDVPHPTVVAHAATLQVEHLEVDWIAPHAGFSGIVLPP